MDERKEIIAHTKDIYEEYRRMEIQKMRDKFGCEECGCVYGFDKQCAHLQAKLKELKRPGCRTKRFKNFYEEHHVDKYPKYVNGDAKLLFIQNKTIEEFLDLYEKIKNPSCVYCYRIIPAMDDINPQIFGKDILHAYDIIQKRCDQLNWITDKILCNTCYAAIQSSISIYNKDNLLEIPKVSYHKLSGPMQDKIIDLSKWNGYSPLRLCLNNKIGVPYHYKHCYLSWYDYLKL